MGTLELGMHVESKLWAKGQLLVSHLDVPILALLNDGTGIHGLDHGVNRVLQVLKKDRISDFDGILQNFDHLGVRKTGNLEITILLTLFDPGDTLELWVDNK